MHAANQAIEYVARHLEGPTLFFIDNQSTLKLLFNTKPHLAFELARSNCQNIGKWLAKLPNNSIEFRWMPGHLGFDINEHADRLADVAVIGPPPFPAHNIASQIWQNRTLAVKEWRITWATFADCKELKLKKKWKVMLPHAWDSNGKQFITLAGDITTFSRFMRLVSSHAPTGEYHQRFFPDEPRGCTCFQQYQTRSHLLVECPKYSFKFLSMVAFNLANNNIHKILRFLKENPSAFIFDDEPIDIYDPP